MEVSLGQILAWQHLAVMGAAMAVIEALKATLKAVGLPKETSKIVHTILPWLPIILCGVAGFIPNAIQANEVGLRVVLGVMLGGVSGQAWKIVKTKVELLAGKVG